MRLDETPIDADGTQGPSRLAESSYSAYDASKTADTGRSVSTSRFIVWIAMITVAVIAMYFKKFGVATPLLGLSGIVLMPRRQLQAPLTRRTTAALVTVAIAAFAAIACVGTWLNCAVPVSTRDALARIGERVFTTPLGLTSLWLALVYVGARRWRRQIEIR